MGSGPPVLSQRFTGWQPNTQDQIWEVSDVNQSIEPAAPRPYWTAGKVHRGANEEGLINEIPPDPSSGEASLTVDSGDYFLSVEAATLKWSITFTKVG